MNAPREMTAVQKAELLFQVIVVSVQATAGEDRRAAVRKTASELFAECGGPNLIESLHRLYINEWNASEVLQ
jgi:hypothetical protein